MSINYLVMQMARDDSYSIAARGTAKASSRARRALAWASDRTRKALAISMERLELLLLLLFYRNC